MQIRGEAAIVGLDVPSRMFCKDMGPCRHAGLKTCPHAMRHLTCRPALSRWHASEQRPSKEFEIDEWQHQASRKEVR